jgi:hypothetical protein
MNSTINFRANTSTIVEVKNKEMITYRVGQRFKTIEDTPVVIDSFALPENHQKYGYIRALLKDINTGKIAGSCDINVLQMFLQ